MEEGRYFSFYELVTPNGHTFGPGMLGWEVGFDLVLFFCFLLFAFLFLFFVLFLFFILFHLILFFFVFCI
jgi:hypothetical protein